MKLFWVFIALLAIATGVLLAIPNRKDTSAPDLSFSSAENPATRQMPTTTDASHTTPPPKHDGLAQGQQASIAAPDSSAGSPSSPPTAPVTPAKDDSIALNTIQDLDALLNLPPTAGETPTDRASTPDVAANLSASLPPAVPAGSAPSESPSQAASDPSSTTPPPHFATELAPSTLAKFKEVVPARLRTSDDGWITLDERFNIRGQGTAEAPYEVSWDLLVSASETFQPRMGKVRMPERIAMLDGKFVRVTGYVAFPIMATSQNELLSMRSMWDGCCIGVPPTPYDAVEVRLKNAATGKERFASFGTIEGKLSVDPYIKGNWLLGLYLMEDASLSQVKEGTDPKKHGGM